MKNSAKFGIGLGVGMLLGIGAAMLLAPKSGKETRKYIADKVKDIKSKIRRKEK